MAVNDGGGRARLARGGLATTCVKRIMDAIERAVPAPQIEIIVDRRARRQVLGDRPATGSRLHRTYTRPFTTSAHAHSPLIAAALGWRKEPVASSGRPHGITP